MTLISFENTSVYSAFFFLKKSNRDSWYLCGLCVHSFLPLASLHLNLASVYER